MSRKTVYLSLAVSGTALVHLGEAGMASNHVESAKLRQTPVPAMVSMTASKVLS